jgi:hypothetical protein
MKRVIFGFHKTWVISWTAEKLLIITGQQKKTFSWFLGLFLGLFGALIQKNALDRPHQL